MHNWSVRPKVDPAKPGFHGTGTCTSRGWSYLSESLFCGVQVSRVLLWFDRPVKSTKCLWILDRNCTHTEV